MAWNMPAGATTEQYDRWCGCYDQPDEEDEDKRLDEEEEFYKWAACQQATEARTPYDEWLEARQEQDAEQYLSWAAVQTAKESRVARTHQAATDAPTD